MTVRAIHVLLIEDGEFFSNMVQAMLLESEQATYEVERVSALAPGLNHLTNGSVDVILLDLVLPDSQGLETLKKVRDVAEEPIVVFTSQDDSAMAIEAVREGAQDYLIKGETDSKLLSRVLWYAIERFSIVKELEDRNDRLKQLNDVMTDREEQMIKLKVEVNALLNTLGQPSRYEESPV